MELLPDEDVERYIAAISLATGMNMTRQRQAMHIAAFQRLLCEANELCVLMGEDIHLDVGPITLLKHNEANLGASR